jgi:hypothetical protein
MPANCAVQYRYPHMEAQNGRQQSEIHCPQPGAPRVQIEYDVELYGAEKKVQLPFVMGRACQTSRATLLSLWHLIAERKFLEIDVDNFDTRMKSMKHAGSISRCPTPSPARAICRCRPDF